MNSIDITKNILYKVFFNKYLILIFRFIIGFVFIYSSIWKISDPESFARGIENYHLMPIFLINLIAIILPWLELILGLFVITGILIRASSFLVSVLMGLFTIMILSAILRNLDTGCGCFSSFDTSNSINWNKFIENTGLLIISVLIYLSPESNLTLENYFVKQNQK